MQSFRRIQEFSHAGCHSTSELRLQACVVSNGLSDGGLFRASTLPEPDLITGPENEFESESLLPTAMKIPAKDEITDRSGS